MNTNDRVVLVLIARKLKLLRERGEKVIDMVSLVDDALVDSDICQKLSRETEKAVFKN